MQIIALSTIIKDNGEEPFIADGFNESSNLKKPYLNYVVLENEFIQKIITICEYLG